MFFPLAPNSLVSERDAEDVETRGWLDGAMLQGIRFAIHKEGAKA
jgi:hypothetical protein